MPGSPKRMDADSAGKSQGAAYQVVYLTKRLSYEFVFTIPEDPPLFHSANQALLQMRFKDQHQVREVVLDLDELEDFYEGLSQVVEYIKAERERRSGQL
jgi:hypothetical protein